MHEASLQMCYLVAWMFQRMHSGIPIVPGLEDRWSHHEYALELLRIASSPAENVLPTGMHLTHVHIHRMRRRHVNGSQRQSYHIFANVQCATAAGSIDL